jgi:uncharacterized membrane protein
MIERKALWISAAIILAMIAASVWRLGLAPDWHHIFLGRPGHRHAVSWVYLFIAPLCVLIFTGILFARKWLTAGPQDALQSWQHWSGIWVVSNSVIIGLFHAALISRSLGFGPKMAPLTLARIEWVAMGILMIVLGNTLPKLPWLLVRFRRFQLDPWQSNRQTRFAGKLMVGMGLFLAIAAPLLPVKMMLPAMTGVWLAAMATSFWHRAKVRREPSPLS